MPAYNGFSMPMIIPTDKERTARILRRSAFILASLITIFFAARAPAYGELKKLETRYATLYYSNETDFYGFGKNIGSLGLFNRSIDKAYDATKERLNFLVERVEAILDMRPGNLRFGVYVYATRAEMHTALRAIGIMAAEPIAFYSHRTKAVYVSNEDLREGVLAHEIAHAVICFYFATPPPANMQEILAQYVDRHLWD